MKTATEQDCEMKQEGFETDLFNHNEDDPVPANKWSKSAFIIESLADLQVQLIDDAHTELLRFNKELVTARFQRRASRIQAEEGSQESEGEQQ